MDCSWPNAGHENDTKQQTNHATDEYLQLTLVDFAQHGARRRQSLLHRPPHARRRASGDHDLLLVRPMRVDGDALGSLGSFNA